MSDKTLEERVEELEERVSYLEGELEISVDERRFERRIERLSRADQEYEISKNEIGNYRATMNIPADQMSHFVDRIANMDSLGWFVKDADDGEIVIRVEEGLVR
jgi:uncharacterized coiled-coil protein SlyX